MDNNKLPKRERLSGRRRIEALFVGGSSGFVYPFKYIYLCPEGGSSDSGVSLLFPVPRKSHKRAVRRNKIRRRTREAFRLNKSGLCRKAADSGRQVDVALIYVSKESEPYKTIENAVGRILEQIAENI